MQKTGLKSKKSGAKPANRPKGGAERPRLTREAWLQASLDVLERRGTPALTLEQITAELGVSRGSFYWHFSSHGEFLLALAELWAEVSTDWVTEWLGELDGTPRERLEALMRKILELRTRVLDLQFHSLAISQPQVRSVVERVDRLRFDVIESLFRELGFNGDALRVRTHCFVVQHSLESGILAGPGEDGVAALVDERLRFFLGEDPG